MEFIRGSHNLRARHRGCVATIGNFDGLHLGHQVVLGQLAEKGADWRLPTTVIIFEPQPMEVLNPAAAPPRLTRLREKLNALRRFSVDRVLCLRFDDSLMRIAPAAFIRQVLVEGLGVRYLVVGEDFRFGYRRQGDFAMLVDQGGRYGFSVARMKHFQVDGERVSSTRIREALRRGDLQTAEKLLGRRYRMSGRVARGDRRGRTLGFPTANIHLHRKATPVQGVFAVEFYGAEPEPLHGVANVGTRPTVDGTCSLLEVHLLDYDRDLYGRHVHIDFLQKLRSEKKFTSVEQLRAQIARDVAAARHYFEQDDP